MERFSGKLALVTGVTRGIGAAIAKELLKRKFTVVGTSRSADRIKAIQDEIAKHKSEYPGEFCGRVCDVTDEKSIKENFQWMEKTFGPVYILVNNAGITLENDRSIETIDGKDFDTVLHTNAKGTILCCKEAFISMVKNSTEGHILNICSIVGHPQHKHESNLLYVASKHVIRVVSEYLRREITNRKLPIKVSNISPGMTETVLLNITGYKAKSVQSDALLVPEDIAKGCITVIDTPTNVLVSEYTIEPIHRLI